MKIIKRRNDTLLIAVLLAAALMFFLILQLHKKPGGHVVALINGEQTASYPLNKDTSVRLENPEMGSYNILVIQNGYAYITEASCPDKLCVKHRKVRYDGETLVCLPNKTVVKIVSDQKPDTDFVS